MTQLDNTPIISKYSYKWKETCFWVSTQIDIFNKKYRKNKYQNIPYSIIVLHLWSEPEKNHILFLIGKTFYYIFISVVRERWKPNFFLSKNGMKPYLLNSLYIWKIYAITLIFKNSRKPVEEPIKYYICRKYLKKNHLF